MSETYSQRHDRVIAAFNDKTHRVVAALERVTDPQARVALQLLLDLVWDVRELSILRASMTIGMAGDAVPADLARVEGQG